MLTSVGIPESSHPHGTAIQSHPPPTCSPEIAPPGTPAVQWWARRHARQMSAARCARDVFRVLRSRPLVLWPEIDSPLRCARLDSISSPPWSARPRGQDAQGERILQRPCVPHVGVRVPWTPPRWPVQPEDSQCCFRFKMNNKTTPVFSLPLVTVVLLCFL